MLTPVEVGHSSIQCNPVPAADAEPFKAKDSIGCILLTDIIWRLEGDGSLFLIPLQTMEVQLVRFVIVIVDHL